MTTFLSKPLLVRIMDKLTEKGVIEIAEEYVKQDLRDIEIMMVKGFELSSFSLLIIGLL